MNLADIRPLREVKFPDTDIGVESWLWWEKNHLRLYVHKEEGKTQFLAVDWVSGRHSKNIWYDAEVWEATVHG